VGVKAALILAIPLLENVIYPYNPVFLLNIPPQGLLVSVTLIKER
jgi:hypothetical protein